MRSADDRKKPRELRRGRRNDAEHPPEGPGEVSRIGEASCMSGGSERGALEHLVERGIEPKPERVAPETHTDLLIEQVSEATRGQPEGARQVAARWIGHPGRAQRTDRGGDARVERTAGGHHQPEPLHCVTKEIGCARGIQLGVDAVRDHDAQRRHEPAGESDCRARRRGEDATILALGLNVEEGDGVPAASQLMRLIAADDDAPVAAP